MKRTNDSRSLESRDGFTEIESEQLHSDFHRWIEVFRWRAIEDLGARRVWIALKGKWGSENGSDSAELHSRLKEIKASELGLSVDLGRIVLRSSVSHCRTWGGFALAEFESDGLAIGFDVEEEVRVRPEVAERICQDSQEALRAPSPGALWTAKEAAFKSLQDIGLQPKVILEVVIENWKPIPASNLFAFSYGVQSLGSSQIENPKLNVPMLGVGLQGRFGNLSVAIAGAKASTKT